MKRGKIEIVDDEKSIAEALAYSLQREGFETVIAHDGVSALEIARRELPDLVLLDWMLPGLNGLEVCRALSQDRATRHIQVVMLTVRSDETDRVLGLEMGADDYITKPFSTAELVARVKARLRRRPESEDPEVFESGGLRIDFGRHMVTLDGIDVGLTSKEFHLLKALVEARGRVLGREFLLENVWGYDRAADVGSRTVDLHISQLRRKLHRVADWIVTVKGSGYRFALEG